MKKKEGHFGEVVIVSIIILLTALMVYLVFEPDLSQIGIFLFEPNNDLDQAIVPTEPEPVWECIDERYVEETILLDEGTNGNIFDWLEWKVPWGTEAYRNMRDKVYDNRIFQNYTVKNETRIPHMNLVEQCKEDSGFYNNRSINFNSQDLIEQCIVEFGKRHTVEVPDRYFVWERKEGTQCYVEGFDCKTVHIEKENGAFGDFLVCGDTRRLVIE